MGNLAFKTINTKNEYKDLGAELGITFEVGKKYQIQSLTSAYFIVSEEKPKEGGFLIFDNKPFGYAHLGQTLWVRTVENRPAQINVSEG